MVAASYDTFTLAVGQDTWHEVWRAPSSCPTNVTTPLLAQIIEVVATTLYESGHTRSGCLANKTRYAASTGLPLAYHYAFLCCCLVIDLKLAPQPPSAWPTVVFHEALPTCVASLCALASMIRGHSACQPASFGSRTMIPKPESILPC